MTPEDITGVILIGWITSVVVTKFIKLPGYNQKDRLFTARTSSTE